MKYARLGSGNLRNGGQWVHWLLEPVSRTWMRRAATSASSSLRSKSSSVVRMSARPTNSRTSCIVAPLRIASLIAVVRSEWMPMPRLPSRDGSIPAPRNIS